MIEIPSIHAFDILEHGGLEKYDGLPDQRLTRKLNPEEVAAVRALVNEGMPIYRIWQDLFVGKCSYHTVRRVARREHYREQP